MEYDFSKDLCIARYSGLSTVLCSSHQCHHAFRTWTGMNVLDSIVGQPRLCHLFNHIWRQQDVHISSEHWNSLWRLHLFLHIMWIPLSQVLDKHDFRHLSSMITCSAVESSRASWALNVFPVTSWYMEPSVFNLGSHVSFLNEGRLAPKYRGISSALPSSFSHSESWYINLGMSKTFALCPMRTQWCRFESRYVRNVLNTSSVEEDARSAPFFDRHLFPRSSYAMRKPWTAVALGAISLDGVTYIENDDFPETAANCKILGSTCCLQIKIDVGGIWGRFVCYWSWCTGCW